MAYVARSGAARRHNVDDANDDVFMFIYWRQLMTTSSIDVSLFSIRPTLTGRKLTVKLADRKLDVLSRARKQ